MPNAKALGSGSTIGSAMDALEARRMFAAQVDFANFANSRHLVSNGYDGAPLTVGSRLRLSDGTNWDARSVWYDSKVSIKKFRTDFSFQSDARADTADGFTFTIQNSGTNALGALGQDLGYAGIDKSQAVTFNLYNRRSFGSKFDYATNGERPEIVEGVNPIDLHSGHLFHATISYDGKTLTTVVSDATDRSKVFTASKQVDLTGTVGGSSAYIGFTAGTGEFDSTQDITSWTFQSGSKPTPSPAPTPTPVPTPVPLAVKSKVVTTDRTTLDIISGYEASSSYAWSVVSQPDGARAPLVDQASDSAMSAGVQFFKDGQYTFHVIETSAAGQTSTTNVNVRVKPTATKIVVTPDASVIQPGTTTDFDAVVLDQFGRPLREQPEVTFSSRSLAGTIDSETGIFTASVGGSGAVRVWATAGKLSGKADSIMHV